MLGPGDMWNSAPGLKLRQKALQIVPRCDEVAWPADSARQRQQVVHCHDMSSDKTKAVLFRWVAGKVYQAGTVQYLPGPLCYCKMFRVEKLPIFIQWLLNIPPGLTWRPISHRALLAILFQFDGSAMTIRYIQHYMGLPLQEIHSDGLHWFSVNMS
jgi:hypothetical protein